MMRKKIVVANWKMNLTVQEGVSLINELENQLLEGSDLDVIVILAVPFTHLKPIVDSVNGRLIISAQNCSLHEYGAYTGEISADMILSTGAKYVILGHSERREYHLETDSILADKIDISLKYGLKVIYCCGENLIARDSDTYFELVQAQISQALFHLNENEIQNVVIAYEPVWAIGTGVTASPKQAQDMHAFIRKLFQDKYGKSISDKIPILYGGSCNPTNAKDLFSQQDIDGGLIGGASLRALDFKTIIHSF